MIDNTSYAVTLFLIKPPLISMQCFIRYSVTACDLWILTSAQQLSQQILGEYLMFFQNNTHSKFTTAQNETLFFHQFNQTNVQSLSSNVGYSKHCTQDNIFKDYFFTALFDFGVPFLINFPSSLAFLGFRKSSGTRHHVLFG